MITAIIFDCFGVLTSDNWLEFTTSLPEEQRQPCSDLNHAYDRGMITRQDFMEQVEELTGRRPHYIDDELASATTKNLLLLGYIKELSEDYQIGLLSNVGTNWIRDHFLTDEEQAFFDAMAFSYDIKYTKPDPRAFEIIAERLHTPVEQCVMIDDIDRYCEAARDTGMQAVHYRDFAQLKRELTALLDK